ncbi:MAG TPA: ADOP family duplicated permease [Bryobacterales bacterium]|nr:ADOP family duplicated permease [Bryobacterales bacterium]
MRWLIRIRMVLSDLRRNRFEREMDQELQTFLALDAEERERSGASAKEAKRTARVDLGGVEPAKERLRDFRAGARLESFIQDFQTSARMLRNRPGFSAAAILTIALGIGPLTAVLSLANGLFFRPAPGVRDAGDLVQVEFVTRTERGSIRRASVSYPNYADLMDGNRVFSGLAGQAHTSVSIVAPGGEARRVAGWFVMHDYFEVLGVRMAAGRPFRPQEDREPGGAPVAILSYRLGRTLFGESDSAPGRTLVINGLPFTVIGVAPQEFHGTEPGELGEIWLTGATSLYVNHTPRERWDRGRVNGVFNVFIGRLTSGVGFDTAKAEITRATRALADAYPGDNEKFRTAEVWMAPRPGLPIISQERVAFFVTLLGCVGSLLLLLAAANVANLLLLRSARRRNEIALRQALGATRWRLVRAQFMDSVILALAGAAAGVLLAFWSTGLLEGVVLPGVGSLPMPIDWRVTALALAGTIFMGLVFGGAPAILTAKGGSVARVLQRAGVSSTRRGHHLRNALTVAQLAISLALLVGALLLLVTIRNLRGVDLGLDPSRIAGSAIDLENNGYDDPRALVFYQSLLERATRLPGIEAIAVSEDAPFHGMSHVTRVHRVDDDRQSAIEAAYNAVSADYFHVLDIPILHGRSFTQAEAFTATAVTPSPVILSESLATRLFGKLDAVGHVLVLPKNASHPRIECHVVGVARDVRWHGAAADVEPFLYHPLGRDTYGLAGTKHILARSDRPSSELPAALRRVVASIDPAVPLYADRSLTEALEMRMAQELIISRVLAVLALLGLLMASVGLHGLVAETVVERTREFGLRMAIGADRRAIFAAVLRRTAMLAVSGIVVGLGLAFALSHVLKSQLFGVTSLDPLIYLSASGLLAGVVVLASLAPAFAATRVNPVEALRAE